jgi:serine protease Do
MPWGALVLSLAALRAPGAGEVTFEHVKPSLFTIQLHSGTDKARDVLGSGYLVSTDGLVVTNYHVVGAYVEDPDRYRIQARNAGGEYKATLVQFDLVNDLAVVRIAPPAAAPLRLAEADTPPGSSIVAFGNPQGLGISLIEGIFNGFAEKGTIDRMLLSMPLNSGMSGGPILNAREEVIGTNVSVMWLSNSLSFGVPVSKVRPLLERAPLATDKESLRQEVVRQLTALAADATERVVRPLADPARQARVTVGGGETREPPALFECWNATDLHKDEGVTKTRYGCNLQFTPAVEEVGPVGSVDLLVEHFRSRDSGYGFYGILAGHAAEHHEVEPRAPENGVFSAPECRADRLQIGALAWSVNTCLYAYVRYPGFYDFDLAATSLSRPREALYLAVHMKGFGFEAFDTLTRALLADLRFTAP